MYLILSTAMFSLLIGPLFDFDKAWKEAQEAIDQGRPKDALDVALEIYKQADSSKNHIQKTKAVAFIAGLKLSLEENAGIEIQKFLLDEISKSNPPFKNILHSQYAGFLDNYFNNNRYQISQRTETSDDTNLLTMTNERFFKEISFHYNKSIDDLSAIQIPVDDYKILFNEYNEEGKAVFPTLYEVLANRALSYYINHGQDISNVSGLFKINEDSYFNSAENFISKNFNFLSEGGNLVQAIKTFQQILKIEIDNKRFNTLTFFDLKRLQFVYQNSTLKNRDELYIKALKNGMALYTQYPECASFNATYVNFLYQKNNSKLFTEIVTLCESTIKKYPKTQGALECQNVLNAINTIKLDILSETALDEKEDVKYRLNTRNLNKVFLKIVETPKGLTDFMYYDGEESAKAMLVSAKIIKTWEEKISAEKYIDKSSLFNYGKLPLGAYTIIASDKEDFTGYFSIINIQITNLSYIHFTGNNTGTFLVVDRHSGKPIKGAKVEVFESNYDYQQRKNVNVKIGEYITDKEGKAICTSNEKNLSVIIKFKKDEFKGLNQHYIYKRNEEDYQTREAIEIYTDRAIYRPGQTVYFKVLSLNYDRKDKASINKNHGVNIKLNDANGVEVSNLNLKTNDFGSASGSFVLPSGRLTGMFSLQNEFGYKPVRVEEYKRPTFEVLIDTNKAAIKLGDVIHIDGKAKTYSGLGVTKSEVKYEIYRQTILPWCFRWYPVKNQNEFVTSGITKTDDEGKFKFDFTASYEENLDVRPIYRFQVKVSVLDGTGEKREAEYYVSLSKKSLFLETNIPAVLDKASLETYSIIARNQDNEIVNAKGKYTIYKLLEPKKNDRQDFLEEVQDYNLTGRNKRQEQSKYEKWKVEKSIASDQFVSNDKISLKTLNHGVYKIEITDLKNQSDSLNSYFVITDHKSKKFPIGEKLYVKTNKDSYKINDEVQVSFGSADKSEKHVYMVLSRGNKILKSGWTKFKSGFDYKYKLDNEDIGGVKLSYAYVEENRYYEGHMDISVPDPDKDLIISYETFRDKLIPGEQVEYKIKISGKGKDKVYAEVLAAMYDASLDVFEKNSWNHLFKHEIYQEFMFHGVLFGANYSRNLNYAYNNSTSVDEIITPLFPELYGFFNSQNFYHDMNAADAVYAPASMQSGAVEVKSKSRSVTPTSGINNDETLEESNSSVQDVQKPQPVASPRKNLNETVFFFPHVKTDVEGNIILSFKMNEALTRWRLMIMAHNQNLATAFSEKFIETKKDLVIVANNPRFLRDEDELWFTARVSNLGNKAIIANAAIQLFDAVNDSEVNDIIVSNAQLNVSLAPGESKAVEWKLKLPKNKYNLLKYVVSVKAAEFTDAESNVIPVLNNNILITETLAMSLKGNESKKYNFTSLTNKTATMIPQRYVVEMSSHPLWYAIQAMPYIIEQDNESATSLANKLFVNGLSLNIVQQYPQVETVFQRWKSTQSDALLSNIEKNQELKQALLEETPWVMDAIKEGNQKQNIVRLFDENNAKADFRQNLAALKELKLPDGSFSWHRGGRPDYYTTKYVVEKMAALQEMGYTNELDFLYPSINYLNSELTIRYKKLKEDYKKSNTKIEDYFPSNDEVHHLYVVSHFNEIEKSAETVSAESFYFEQAAKNWTKYNIYIQSLLGKTDFRGKRKVYNDIAKSIMQKSFKSDELGVYWNEGSGYRWHEMAIDRHAAIMDFLHEIKYVDLPLDEMKVWLLKNKQGNNWNTGNGSVSAIKALLLNNGPRQNNLVDAESGKIKTGNILLPVKGTVQAGTSYYKHEWKANEINASLGQIEVSNPNKNIAWGGVYYQYLEDIDKVKSSVNTPLKIQKQLYKEVSSNKGLELIPINEKTTLHPGDMMVSRLVISVDRDMDYIHIKDMRASGFEPASAISGYNYKSGLGYYESIRDLATHYYIYSMGKGTYVLESKHRAVHKGRFSGGIATIQSYYAPEFSAKTDGNILKIE